MDKMNNKPIKQMGAIETSILNQSNTPLVPPQFQTGAYVDPTSVVQNPPVVPQPNMGNQMGATPIYQTDPPEKQKYSKEINTRPMTSKQLADYDNAVTSYKDSTQTWISGKGPEPKVPDYTSFKLTPKEKEEYK